ncbi:hypothetical protein [Streptomyces orinoci]|uniref:Uncharacterized protein n=1 Tax=Streptomyces orinoci TaxID=67339 RepID=A0ABV3K730_STRON|nr:hypothetical protein [Streptomyces orinoci]
MTTVLLSIRPALPAAWFHHLLTRPFIELDGTEHPAKWGEQSLDLAPGTHRLGVCFRYRVRSSPRLAESVTQLTVPDTPTPIPVRARLGLPNGSHFHIDGPSAPTQGPGPTP